MRARPLLTALACMLSLAVATPAAALAVDGYRISQRAELANGVEHLRYERNGPEMVANVAKVSASAPVHLRPVAAISGPLQNLERTSAMCQRVECLVAINGDFAPWDEPVGALAIDGELLRSPSRAHHNFMVLPDGSLKAGQLKWRGRLVASDFSDLRLDSVNRERRAGDLVLYTGAYGPSTRTNDFGVEMVVRFVRGRSTQIGDTTLVRAASYVHGKGDSPIPAGGAVLSAHGKAARALGKLWERIRKGEAGRELLLRVETTPQVDTAIGGTPVLVRDGRVWFSDQDTAFMRERSPRTMVGWNPEGDLWLVTVDGRQAGHSLGFSLSEAAEFLLSLGATDALNLDGGGSSTFVVGGAVVNRPSDRAVVTDGVTTIVQGVARGVMAANVERPVANALALVADETTEAAANLPGPATEARALALPVPAGTDPASNPASDLPAIGAYPAGQGSAARTRGLAIAALLNLGVLVAHVRRRISAV